MLLPWMTPHKVIPWQRAIVLSFLGKVEVVVEYDEVVRSPSIALRAPAVVRMRRVELPRRGALRFCRGNVFRRDGFACQYCGAVLRARELTFDHVVPRARRPHRVGQHRDVLPAVQRPEARSHAGRGGHEARAPSGSARVAASGGPARRAAERAGGVARVRVIAPSAQARDHHPVIGSAADR